MATRAVRNAIFSEPAGTISTDDLGLRIHVDLNGNKSPNAYGKDIFVFHPKTNGGVVGFATGWSAGILKSRCQFNLSIYNYYCTGWIQNNGWKIPDDYPWL